jgi:hypothetical protein
MFETVESQRKALSTPVDPRFVNTNKNVKGPYTTGDYVRWKLNEIFGPDHWSHTIVQGPEIVQLSEQSAYVRVIIRLTVKFANGEQVTHDDIGFAPLQATQGARLDGTAPERYETVWKSAITDGVKACAEYLGICFRPLADGKLNRELAGSSATPALEEREPEYPPGEPARPPRPRRTGATTVTANEFWTRFHELLRAGAIGRELEKSPEIEKAKSTGDWAAALHWLNEKASG